MDYNFLAAAALFKGISPEEIRQICSCIGAREKVFGRGGTIYGMGDTVTEMGLVLSGSVSIESSDLWGSRSVMDRVDAGQVFAETYACLTDEPLMVSAVALEETAVLFLNVRRIVEICASGCAYHHNLLKNLLEISARKNLGLSRRSLHTAPKSLRERVRSFLSYQAVRNGSSDFFIPFNRQQMADYLNVDRSALSAELGKMRKEGLLDFKRSHFKILQKMQRR